MSRSVLVINPWVTDFKLYDEWMHPLGLYFLISLLKHNGRDVHYCNCLQRDPSSKSKRFSTGDFEYRDFPKPEIYRSIKRRYKLYGISREALSASLSSLPPPDVIFFGSGMTYWFPGLIQTVRFVRGLFPQTPVVIGGVCARLIPEHCKAALPGVHVFQGSLFDRSLPSGSGIPALSGLRVRGWEPSLIDAYNCLSFALHGPALSSLGCPGSCSYCASAVLQGAFAVRKTDLVADEIEYLHDRFGAEDFAFFDDALLYSPEKNFIPLLETLTGRGLKCRYHTPNGLQARQLSLPLCALMKKAGFRTLRFGFETSDVRFRTDTTAKASREELAQKIQIVKESGFSASDAGVYVMAGFPGQTPADVVGEIDFVASLGVAVKPVFLSPVPRTKLFESYRSAFPDLVSDPLWHNDSFFITKLPGWNEEAVQLVVDAAKKNNQHLNTTSSPAKPDEIP